MQINLKIVHFATFGPELVVLYHFIKNELDSCLLSQTFGRMQKYDISIISCFGHTMNITCHFMHTSAIVLLVN